MIEESRTWIWNIGTTPALIGMVLFLLYAGISLYHLWQTRFTRYRCVTEALKLVGAVLLLLTLFQPELHTRSARHENARVAVVLDDTDSMLAPDVEVDGAAATRKEWVEKLQASPEWEALADAVQLETIRVGHDDEPVFRQTDLQSGLSRARSVEQLAAVLMLSDGAHNAPGSPLPEALRLAEDDVPVYAVEIGQRTRLPDLVLEPVMFPAYSLLNEAMVLPVRVSSTLPEDAPTRVALYADEQMVASQEILVPAGGSASTSLRWTPRMEGATRFEVRVDPHPLERFLDNNEDEAVVDIRRTTIRVLLVDSIPRWEYRFLRNALSRDPGVEVDSLLFHPDLGPGSGPGYIPEFPVDREGWSKYDVIFLGDVGLGQGELRTRDVENLAILVREQAAGLVFLPGPRAGHLRLLNTPLESLMPVEYDTRNPRGVGMDLEMRMSLTREGQDHMLTQLHANPVRNQQIWRQLPGFFWYASVRRPRVGTEVLATHASQRNEHGRIPLLATRNAGTGHVLFLGTDAAYRWRIGVEDLYHYRFWGQVVRWMAHRRHMFGDEGARLFLQPERPQMGQNVNVTVALRSAFAVTDEVPVRMRFTSPEGEVVNPMLSPLEGGGTYEAEWTPEMPGTYILELFSPDDPSAAWFSTEVMVEGRIPEEIGEPMRPALLREMAQVTGGRSVSMDEARELLVRLRELPRQQVVVSVNRIWQHPLWITGFFFFFGLYWILRKRQGWI
ncbi:MAG: hypothetical protein JJU29_14745 [Verrucomicrobia bacterium]|nr:hypothetical protein [Verrucomicrobiota bacterium]MCH8513226.1 hypothetical protein [Kiritimatiellia bacterium]